MADKYSQKVFDVFDKIALEKASDDARRDAASSLEEAMRIARLARDAGLKAEKAGHLSSFPLESGRGAIQISVTKEQYTSGVVPKEVRDILFTELDVRGRSKQEIAYRKCLLGESPLTAPSRLEQLLVDPALSVPEMTICVETEGVYFGEFLVLDPAKNIADVVAEHGNAKWLAQKDNYMIGKEGRNYVIVMRTGTAGNTVSVVADMAKKLFRTDYSHDKGFSHGNFGFNDTARIRKEERVVVSAVNILRNYLKSEKKFK